MGMATTCNLFLNWLWFAILFTAMYPMIFFRFGDSNYIINNNTMTNTTLDNYTYY